MIWREKKLKKEVVTVGISQEKREKEEKKEKKERHLRHHREEQGTSE